MILRAPGGARLRGRITYYDTRSTCMFGVEGKQVLMGEALEYVDIKAEPRHSEGVHERGAVPNRDYMSPEDRLANGGGDGGRGRHTGPDFDLG
eukprot:4502400-Alexandrium_andersonii.AAC.1